MNKNFALPKQILIFALSVFFVTSPMLLRADTPEQTEQYKYALGLIQRHLYEEAGKVLNRILSEPAVFSQADGALFWLAECEYRQKNWLKSIGLYDKLLKSYPNSIFYDRAAYGLGWAHSRDNNPKSAVEAFARVRKTDPQLWIDANMKRGFLMVKYSMDGQSVIDTYESLLAQPELTDTQKYECHLQAGIGKFNKSIFPQALKHFEQALPLCPEEKKQPLLFYVAESNFRARKFDEAKNWYGKTIAQDPNSVISQKASYSLAWCNIKLKNPDEALKIFKRLTEMPNSVVRKEAAKNLIDLLMNMHQYPEAIKWMTTAIEIVNKKDKEQLLYLKGLAQSRTGEFTDSIRTYESFQKMFPKSLRIDETIYQIGLSYVAMSKFPEALKEFEKINSDKTDPEIREKAIYRIGECYFNLGNIKLAGDNFSKLLKLFPTGKTKYDALYQLGELAYMTNSYAEALAAFETIAKGNQELSSQALFRAGEVLMKAARYPDAIERFNAYLDTYPEGKLREDAIFKKGLCFLEIKDQGQALAAFSQLGDAKGYFRQESRFQIAEIARSLKNYPLAIQHYKAIVAEEPTHPLASRAKRATGISLYMTGDYPAAIETFKKLLKDYPSTDAAIPESQLWLGKSLIANKDIDEGILAILKVPVLYPQSNLAAEAYAEAAKAYESKDNLKKSLAMWQQVLDSSPSPELKLEAEKKLKN